MLQVKRESEDDDQYHTSGLLAKAVIVSIVGYQVTAIFISTPYYPQFWTLCTIGMCIYSCHYYKLENKTIINK